MKKKHKKPAFLNSMENEIILAVSALYAIIVAIMVIVHYVQPSEQETLSSSTSVSHKKSD